MTRKVSLTYLEQPALEFMLRHINPVHTLRSSSFQATFTRINLILSMFLVLIRCIEFLKDQKLHLDLWM